jgi:predicted ATP-grasp superfamily ATP-dependent carboligase
LETWLHFNWRHELIGTLRNIVARLLILDGHSAAALAVTRSAGRAGHWIAVGANQGAFAPATLSRFCNLNFSYPVSTEDADAFVLAIARFVQEHGIELVIPITEWTTLPLARHRDQVEPFARLALPSLAAVEYAADKFRTFQLARDLGVPVPDTRLFNAESDLASLTSENFPVVVKDRFSVRWKSGKAILGSVAYAYSADELREKVRQRVGAAGDVLVQEFASGAGIGFSCLVVDGKRYLPFQWQRIREVDPRGSGSSCRKAVSLDDTIAEWSTQLIAGIRFSGIAMIEFKKTPSSTCLMEINGRPWGSLQLPIAAGLDYPRYWIDWSLNGTLPPTEVPYREGITCRRLVGELAHLAHLRSGKPKDWPLPYPSFWSSAFKIAIPWYPGVRYDEFAAGDYRPGRAMLAKWWQSHFG